VSQLGAKDAAGVAMGLVRRHRAWVTGDHVRRAAPVHDALSALGAPEQFTPGQVLLHLDEAAWW